MSSLIQYLVSGLAGLAGSVCILGSILKWAWLVDPIIDEPTAYSQAVLKKKFGTTFVRVYTFFLGLMFFLFAKHALPE